MENITFDNGIQEFSIAGGGVLRFNPADPNLFARFMDAQKQLEELEAQLKEKAANAQKEQLLSLLRQADLQVKKLLDQVFGGDNDFDKALGGVNLLAITADGNRVVDNLLDALAKIVTAGAEQFAKSHAAQLRQSR